MTKVPIVIILLIIIIILIAPWLLGVIALAFFALLGLIVIYWKVILGALVVMVAWGAVSAHLKPSPVSLAPSAPPKPPADLFMNCKACGVAMLRTAPECQQCHSPRALRRSEIHRGR